MIWLLYPVLLSFPVLLKCDYCIDILSSSFLSSSVLEFLSLSFPFVVGVWWIAVPIIEFIGGMMFVRVGYGYVRIKKKSGWVGWG